MKKILHLISSPRGEASFSIKLGNAIIEKLRSEYPGSELKVVDLVKMHFPHLEEAHINAFHTPAESQTAESREVSRHSDEAIADLMWADIIVMGAPMYNFTIHSSLKAWLDHIVRSGVTFRYTEAGAEGLIKGKKVYLAISSGGIYSDGPMVSHDFVSPYLKSILALVGLSDVSIFRIEGTVIPGIMDSAVEKGIDSIAL